MHRSWHYLNQKQLLVLSMILTALVGFISVPFMVRGFDEDKLTIATLILFVNSLFGVLDILRPVYISHYSRRKENITYLDIVVPSMFIGLVALLLIHVISEIFLGRYFTDEEINWLSISFLFYILSTGFWAVMDLNGLMGLSLLFRAIGTSLVYISFSVLAILNIEFSLVLVFSAAHFVTLCFFFLDPGFGCPMERVRLVLYF